MKLSLIFWSAIFLGLGACAWGPGPVATNVAPPTATVVTNTPSPISTATPTFTATPTASATPRPTLTATLLPSATPTVVPHALALKPQNIQNLVQLKKFGRSHPYYVVWLPDAAAIVLASAMEISILEAASLQTVQMLEPQVANPEIAIHPDGQRLLVAGTTVQIWDWLAGQKRGEVGYIEGGIRSLALSANGRVLAIAGPAWPGGGDPDYVLRIIDFVSGKGRYNSQQYGIINAVAVDATGSFVASASERGLEIFDGRTGDLRHTISDAFGAITFAPHGPLWQGNQVWDVQTGQRQTTTLPEGLGQPVLSANGQWLAFWNRWEHTGKIPIWDATTWQLVQTLEISRTNIWDVAFSPDGTTLAVITVDGLVLLDVASGEQVASLTAFTPSMEAVAFSGDAQLVLGHGADGAFYAWDLAQGQPVSSTARFERTPSPRAISPDGQRQTLEWIDESSNWPLTGTLRLIDTHTQQIVQELVGHQVVSGEGFTGLIASVAFNGDGSLLASAGYDGSVRVWDVKTGLLLLTLPNQMFLSDVNFSPDGRYLATSSSDGIIRLWGLPTP